MGHDSGPRASGTAFSTRASRSVTGGVQSLAPDDSEDLRHVLILDKLAAKPAVEIALDTEFQDAHTLTIQAATRIGDNIVVQVYRSHDIPCLPRSFQATDYLPPRQYARFGKRIVVRPVRNVTPELSPAEILLDLYRMGGLKTDDRVSGNGLTKEDMVKFVEPSNGEWDSARGQWRLPAIRLRLLAHFWTADLCRVFGSRFFNSLFRPGEVSFVQDQRGLRALALQAHKLLKIVAPKSFSQSPTVQFIHALDGGIYRVELETRDTMLPFGSASLERHCQTFLGLGKCPALSENEKQHMLETFRSRPADAYGYAMVDVVNTLLLYEEMEKQHASIYRSFGWTDSVPPLQPTMGSRVSRFLEYMIASHCKGSKALSRPQRVTQLLRRGGCRLFQDEPGASRFGAQTGGTHGGLLFTRCPNRFWHQAPGQLRDVDMSGCYSRIVSGLNMYCGRPVIYEPGDNPLALKGAIEWVREHADPDAWLIRVTGDLATSFNSFIPSTLDACTASNVRRRRPVRDSKQRQGSKLFSRRIESGVITSATWAVIESLPEPMRSEYESLTAETIVLYPRRLIATTAGEYDELVDRLHRGDLGWYSEVDFDRLRKVDVIQLDDAYIALRFPIQDYARRFAELRQEAKSKYGKGSGAERAWKEQANTMYGVLASGHLATQNFVAANIITATARANAWVTAMVLNGMQTITDGATYCRDQIPACTFDECLRRCPDYTLRRPEGGEIPFMAPAEIPEDDQGFTRWLQERAKWFFGASEEPFSELVSLPVMEHKQTGTTGTTSFDALACDSSGNYVKCTLSDEGIKTHEVAMRGYGPKCREPILRWMIATYSTDRVKRLCPIVDDEVLLKLEPARQAARRALHSGCREVYLPLGLTVRRPKAYKAIKLSAFIFRTPSQYKKLTRQEERFGDRTRCGLELLCLRQKYRRKTPLGLGELASRVYDYIIADGQDLAKKFHLAELSQRQRKAARERLRETHRRRQEAEKDLRSRIDARRMSGESRKTGIYVTSESDLLAP